MAFRSFGAESNQVIWAGILPDVVETANFETIISIESVFCFSKHRVPTQTALSSLVIRTGKSIRGINMLVNAIVKLAHTSIFLRTPRSFLWIYFVEIWTILIILIAVSSKPKFTNFFFIVSRLFTTSWRQIPMRLIIVRMIS